MSDNTAERNAEVVRAFVEHVCNKKPRDPEKAVELYFGPYYKQHSFGVPDGAENFLKVMPGFYEGAPDFQTTIHHIVAQGDLVVVHHHIRMSDDDRGSQVFDMFRLEDGKIVEHWDVVMPIPEGDPNNSGPF